MVAAAIAIRDLVDEVQEGEFEVREPTHRIWHVIRLIRVLARLVSLSLVS
jgi:hypothetical protein